MRDFDMYLPFLSGGGDERVVVDATTDIAAYAASGFVSVCGFIATRNPVASVAAEMVEPFL